MRVYVLLALETRVDNHHPILCSQLQFAIKALFNKEPIEQSSQQPPTKLINTQPATNHNE